MGNESKKSAQIWAYLTGTFGAQIANNALQVTLPLLVLQLSNSLSAVAFITALTTAVDTGGTLLGGRLSGALHPRTLLIVSTASRSVTLALIPLFWAAGSLTLDLAVGLFLLDSLARGVADTARNTMPLVLVSKNKDALDWLNSRYQTAFELGAVVGPFLVGWFLVAFGAVTANWLVPVAFAVSSATYLLIPKKTRPWIEEEKTGDRPTLRNSMFVIASNPGLRLAFIATLLLTLYPLRGVLPALFAESILKSTDQTAWLAGFFGLGALAGSVLYGRIHKNLSSPAWLRWSAAGVMLLAIAWIPGSLVPMGICIFLFASSNVMARLSMVSTLQSQIPQGADGSVMGLNRFSVNFTSVVLRLMVGLAFVVVALPVHAFVLIGAGLIIFALLHLWVSWRLAVSGSVSRMAFSEPRTSGVGQRERLVRGESPGARRSAAHGMTGRLIVFEGLDGSGKSTQVEMLKSHLEAQGLKVVLTSWNFSAYVMETIKKLRKAKESRPDTFSLENTIKLTDRLHRVILEDRFNKVVLPALQEGAIVISDRHFYTSLARDRVRGIDGQWLRELYSSAIRPDLVLYFKLAVEKAVSRVMKRTENSLKLSEEFDEMQPHSPITGSTVKYMEAGLDLRLSEDPVENFRMFQTRVAAEYDGMVPEFGFLVIDTDRTREEVHADAVARALRHLGPLSSFARAERIQAVPNLFVKDPANDPAHIRKNYLHERRGLHFYFRNMLLQMQERFAQLVDHSRMPTVFLHGSPHVDNYSKTEQGAAMVDFDRSRFGPYAWDIVRFLTSLSLRQKNPGADFLDRSVLQQFTKGYLRGFRCPEKGYEEMRKLKDTQPREAESTTGAYLKANKKWAMEMRATPVSPDHADMIAVLRGYLESRSELDLLNEYHVEEAGRGFGSMGRNRFLIALAPKDPQSGKDCIFLEIKRVREDPDTTRYKNSFDHHGKRMIAAAELYAPEWIQRQGFATYQGVQYWGHQIPTQNVKLKKNLDLEEQKDFAYAVGTQLGRGHRLSLQDAPPQVLEEHLKENFLEFIRAAQTIKDEIASAYETYLKTIEQQVVGLKPTREEPKPDISQQFYPSVFEGAMLPLPV